MDLHTLLPPAPLLLAFLAAALVLAITPGPGVAYIVTRTLGQGRRAGLASVAGIALGNLANAVAAALGLSSLMAASPLAFAVLRYAGAALLLWLGLQLLLRPPAQGPVHEVEAGRQPRDVDAHAPAEPSITVIQLVNRLKLLR